MTALFILSFLFLHKKEKSCAWTRLMTVFGKEKESLDGVQSILPIALANNDVPYSVRSLQSLNSVWFSFF